MSPRSFSAAPCFVWRRTMQLAVPLLLFLALAVSSSATSLHTETSQAAEDDATGYGPVFEEQPADTIYPEESLEEIITMNCRARGNPPPTYKWHLNGWELKLQEDTHYSLVDGNLQIHQPDRNRHVGNYECVAQNKYGTIISKEATIKFGYLDPFSTEEREVVRVREGQGAVLLCAPPPHYPEELSFRWMLNEFPIFIPLDHRRFVSQTTGNLYISKVDASDSGNYSCFVSSSSIAKSVFSKFIPLVPSSERSVKKYAADIKVKFPDTHALKGQHVTLECFALGNPIPEIRWKRVDKEMSHNLETSMAGALLHLPNVQVTDEGIYECEALNSKGKDHHMARLHVDVFPEWEEHITDMERDIDSELTMKCVASGKPEPQIRWLKNGYAYGEGEMKFPALTLEDSGMYQCIAENKHGAIFANAELRVVVSAPAFEKNPVKRRMLGAKNGRVVMECKPRAAPKPRLSWTKGTELLSNTSRIHIWEDGSLEILNVTKLDEGNYTCFADNGRGKANSTGSLFITEATKITLAPSNADVQVGEDAQMQCAASHDPSLDIAFIWALNSRVIDFDKEAEHYRRVSRDSSGELHIINTQLKHAGRYTCTAQTIVDNITASAELVVRGPPGPPGGVRVEDIRDKSVRVLWSRGTDNHSPISKYTIQARDSLSQDADEWRDVSTSPPSVEGNAETVTVVDLIPWMEYEFRVIATNTLGTGEPSNPSPKVTTLEAVPVVAPSDIGGGGNTSKELTITWTPVKRQYHYGSNFGYIVAFKQPSNDWRKVMVADPDARHYIHKDPSIPANTEFQVKVKAFNSKGEGPYSLTAVIKSGRDAPSEAPANVMARTLSATEAKVWWLPAPQNDIEGYQIKYWRKQDESETAAQRILVSQNVNQTRLDHLMPDCHYLIEVQAYNTAGVGPSSEHLEIHTKKAPPSRPPRIIKKTLSFRDNKVNIAWEHIESLANESTIQGYKVLYRQEGHTNGMLYTTTKHSIDLPAPQKGDYVVEVRAHSEGGDGAVAQVRISGGAAITAQPLGLLALFLIALCSLGL